MEYWKSTYMLVRNQTFPSKCPQKMGYNFLLNSNDATMHQTFTHDWPLTITLLVLFNILQVVFHFVYISTSILQISRISTLLLMVCPDSLCNVINAQTKYNIIYDFLGSPGPGCSNDG